MKEKKDVSKEMDFGFNLAMAKVIAVECEKIVDKFAIKKLFGKRVLITGGTGFIGYYTVIIFLLLNDIHHAKIQFLLSVRDYEKAKMIFSDILDRGDVHLLVQDLSRDLTSIEGSIDYIIHLANTSEVSALRKLGHTDVFNTIKGTENLLRLAEEKKTEAFLYLSSVTVYGEDDGQEEITEGQYFPHNWLKENASYVNIKRMSESLLKLSSSHGSVRTVILRPGFVYGFNSFPDERIYAKALLQASLGKNIELQSSGYLYRDSIYIIDLVMAMLSALQFGESGEAYNVSGGVISLRSYIDIICEISGVKGIYGEGDDVYGRRYYKKYNTKKIENLGYSSHFTHEDAVKSSLNIGKAWLGRVKT
jgi:Nucleoside-diphosphate-sugar epimerases